MANKLNTVQHTPSLLSQHQRERKNVDARGKGSLIPTVNCLWIAGSVLLQSVAASFSKQAGLTSRGCEVMFIVWNPWYAAQIIALALQAVCWIMALRRFPLSFAYPFMSLIFPINIACSWLFFREEVRFLHAAGIVFIVCGVWIIARDG